MAMASLMAGMADPMEAMVDTDLMEAMVVMGLMEAMVDTVAHTDTARGQLMPSLRLRLSPGEHTDMDTVLLLMDMATLPMATPLMGTLLHTGATDTLPTALMDTTRDLLMPSLRLRQLLSLMPALMPRLGDLMDTPLMDTPPLMATLLPTDTPLMDTGATTATPLTLPMDLMDTTRGLLMPTPLMVMEVMDAPMMVMEGMVDTLEAMVDMVAAHTVMELGALMEVTDMVVKKSKFQSVKKM